MTEIIVLILLLVVVVVLGLGFIELVRINNEEINKELK